MPQDTKEQTFDDIATSDEFLKIPYQERLVIVEEHLSKLYGSNSVFQWANAARHKIRILARLGDFEAADKFLQEHEEKILSGLKGTTNYSSTLYTSGFVYSYVGNIEKAIEMVDAIIKIEGFEDNYEDQQYVDTLLVTLNSLAGNNLQAADILIQNLEDGSVDNLPPMERLKLISNTQYALIEGDDFSRAEKYLTLFESEFKLAEDNKLLTDFELDQLKSYFYSNKVVFLVKQGRHTEVGDFLEDYKDVTSSIGSPLFAVYLDYADAVLAHGSGNSQFAISKIEKAVDTLEMLSTPDVLLNFYSLQVEIYKKANLFEAALNVATKRRELQSTMDKQRSRARVQFTEARIASYEQNAKIVRLESEKKSAELLAKQERILTIISYCGLFLLSVMVFGLLVSRKRLKTYSKELLESGKKAQAATEAKSAFLANMSHEIRTPLNGLLGMTQILSEMALPHKVKKCVDIIESSSESLITIVNDVLDISKIEAGKLTVESVPTDLPHLLDQVTQLWKIKAKEKQIDLKLSIATDVPKIIDCDPVRLRQCISNLLSNAIKFTNEGSVNLHVDVENSNKDSRNLLFRVRDTGIGIPEDTMERLFCAFEQGDTSTTRCFGGTGLGLAITSELATLMGGSINVKSQLGEGSEFLLRINLIERSDENVVILNDRVSQNLIVDNDAQEPMMHFLIVDDNPVNRLVAKAFVEQNNIKVSEAINGKDALEKLNSDEQFDLILLDMHMPVMDGPETIRLIRNSEKAWANVPVITLTADAMQGDRKKYLSIGTDGYVAKPLVRSELEREIQAVLSQAYTKKDHKPRILKTPSAVS